MKRSKLYGCYTLLFWVTACLVFSTFWLHNKTFIWNPDGLLQYYPILGQLKGILHDLSKGEFAFWTWSAGIGADTIANFAFVLFDPFSWLAAAFPKQYIDIGYTVSVLLKLFFSGIGMMALLRYRKRNDIVCIIAGLGYAFSNWAVGSIVHTFFLNALLLLPLIILGIEKAEKERKFLLLIVAVFFSFITSVYFSYMTAIVVGIYLIVNYIVTYKEKSWKAGILYFAKYIGLVLISLCLAAVVVFPMVYGLFWAPKSTGNEAQILHSLSTYIQYLPSLIDNAQVYGNYSYMGAAAVFTVMIPCLCHRMKRKTASPYVWMFGILFLLNLLAFFGSVMNGFSYTSGRWCYAFAFFFIVAAAEGLEAPEIREAVYRKRVYLFLAVLGVIMFIIGKLGFNLGSMAGLFAGFVNILFGLIFIEVLQEGKKKKYQKVLFLLVLNLILLYNTVFSDRISDYVDTNFKYAGESFDKFENSPQKSATKIQDNDFYRVDQVEGISNSEDLPRVTRTPANENLYFGTRTIYTYLSTVDSRIFEFNKALGNAGGYYRRICTFSNDNRVRMDFLTGVKYFLGNSTKGGEKISDYASYGFKKYDRKLGTSILKTDYYTGLGFVYYDVMSRTEFEKLDYLQREQVMLETAVLEDTEAAEGLPVRKATEIEKQGIEQPYEIVETKDVEIEDNKLMVLADDGAITLHINKIENVELYLLFTNLKRKPIDIETIDTEREKYEPSRKRLSDLVVLPDSCDFALTISDGVKSKKALNPRNENQAFNDIENYLVNLGYYNTFKKDVTITFSQAGEYTFNDFNVLSVPIDNFVTQAEKNMQSAFRAETVNGNYVSGSVDCEKDGLLYLSILENPGWKVYVDGSWVENVTNTNYAFMGIPVTAGNHKIELRYRPVGFYPALVLFGVGVISVIILLVLGRKKGHQENEK